MMFSASPLSQPSKRPRPKQDPRNGPARVHVLRRTHSEGCGVALPTLSPKASQRGLPSEPQAVRPQVDARPPQVRASASETQLSQPPPRRLAPIRSPGRNQPNSGSVDGRPGNLGGKKPLPAISRALPEALPGSKAKGQGQGQGQARQSDRLSPKSSQVLSPGHSRAQGAPGVRGPPAVAWDAPALADDERGQEEASALHEISSVASRVALELGRMQEKCEALDCLSEDYFGDVDALREISSVTHQVCDDLNVAQAEASSPAEVAEEISPPIYDDPVLAKARKIAALTNQLCEDLNASSLTFGAAGREAEIAPLHEISAVTKQVFMDMSNLQLEGWAAGVLASVPDKNTPENEMLTEEDLGIDMDDSLPSGRTGKRQNTGAFSKAEGATATDSIEQSAPGQGANEVAEPDSPVGVRELGKDVGSIEGLPDLNEMLAAKAEGGEDGFSDADLNRMRTAFNRFKVPDSADLALSDLTGLVAYLGHVMCSEEGVMPLAKEVTVYEYMDFDEFITFMDKYMLYEKEQFQLNFNKFDDDGSGEISVDELRKLLVSINICPLRGMIKEALGVVDSDNNGQLNFEEFVTFLTVYRNAEGFTRREAVELRRIFDHFGQEEEPGAGKTLAADKLCDSMVQAFGLHVAEFGGKFEEALKSGQGLQKSSYSVGAGGKPETLRFPEFLIFARKVREAVLEKLKVDFPDFSNSGEGSKDAIVVDTDKSGGISEKELRVALKKVGYTPLKQNLDEIFAEVVDGPWTPDREMDFNEFFDFMMHQRQREGFGLKDVKEMKAVFDRFDDDGSGEISTLELADLFRHLGYTATLDDIHIFVGQVDSNASGQLDFREYLKLMSLHREKEVTKMVAVYNAHKQGAAMPKADIADALKALGHEPPKNLALKAASGGNIEFDAFVNMVDSCRIAHVEKERKKAGFSDDEVAEFQKLFDKYDKDKSGEIDTKELNEILKEYGWQPKTREEQAGLMKKLDQARASAREAGIKDVGVDGSSSIRFWTFVQLSRLLRTEHDRAEEDKMTKLMQDLKFTTPEVDQFRQIFRSWTGQDEAAQARTSANPADRDKAGATEVSEALDHNTIRRIVKSLGVAVTSENKGRLEAELTALDKDGLLDFFGFLRLMRWMLDTDFAGVNTAVAKK